MYVRQVVAAPFEEQRAEARARVPPGLLTPTVPDSCAQMCCDPRIGYQSHEPHGSSPVTTQTVVWSWKTAQTGSGFFGLVGAVFACGVHPPVTGSLTPGYALCCPVRATGASRTEQPEA